jgi:hypothetical protein
MAGSTAARTDVASPHAHATTIERVLAQPDLSPLFRGKAA